MSCHRRDVARLALLVHEKRPLNEIPGDDGRVSCWRRAVLGGCAAEMLTLGAARVAGTLQNALAEVWGGSSLFLQEMPKHTPVGNYFNPAFVQYFTKASSRTFY